MGIFQGKFGPVVVAAMLFVGAPVAQASAQDLAPEVMAEADALTEAVADGLKPGEYRWQPERATQGALSVVVSISRQIAYIYRGDALIGVTTVSTGKPGHDTPTGSFRITQKKVQHVSNLYNAPMPFMQRLTDDGIALHAGKIPGYPASHGCVRLPAAFAPLLYGATTIGITVTIQDEDQFTAPVDVAAAEPIGPDAGAADAGLQMASGYAGAAAP